MGIDLGTVNSCMAIYKHGKVNIIETRDGKTTPSVVFYDPKSNQVLLGKSAIDDGFQVENTIYGKHFLIYFNIMFSI